MTTLAIGLDELESLVGDIWRTYVSDDSVVVPVEPPDNPFVADLCSQVMITGGTQATVVVACDTDSANDIARRLFADDSAAPSEADVTDALGEMVNVLGGNVKSLSLEPSVLTLPAPGVRSDLGPVSGRAVSCCVEVIWESGRATLSVWVPPAA